MKRGFTLIELLVYMAIMGFIIVVAGRVFSDSTNMRVRSQNMVKTAEEVGKIANLISEDVSQMGVKSWGKEETSGEYKIYNTENAAAILKLDEVYMDATNKDFSSFKLARNHASNKDGKQFDQLVFRKVEFKANGDFEGVREVTWDVNANGELRRFCQTVAGDANDVCPNDEPKDVLVADNITNFYFYLSKPGVPSSNLDMHDTVFPLPLGENDRKAFRLFPNPSENKPNTNLREIAPLSSGNWEESSISGFSMTNQTEKAFYENYLTRHDVGQISDCLEVPIKKGETYVVEFEMPFPKDNSEDEDSESSSQFLPGKDHIAVGLRINDGKGNRINGISPDVLLYASQSDDANERPRHAEFTANDNFTLDESKKEKACVALIFSFYSPLVVKGKLRFSNFKVFKKPTGAYHFVKSSEYENVVDGDDVKAYATESDASSGTAKYYDRKRNVKALELFLEINRNGEVAGTVSKDSKGMVIPVPNNGVTSL